MDILLLDSHGHRRQNLVDTLEFLEHELVVPVRVTQWANALDGREVDCAMVVVTADDELMHDVFRELRAHDEHLPLVLVTERGPGAARDESLTAGAAVRLDLPLRHSNTLSAMQQVEACIEELMAMA